MKDELLIRNDEVSNGNQMSNCPMCHKPIFKADKVVNLKYATVHEDCINNMPFIITKEIRKFAGETFKVFGLWFSPTLSIEITGKEAKEIIDDYDMVLALDNEDGMLWEDAKGEFHKKFKGHFAKKEKSVARQKYLDNVRYLKRKSQKLNNAYSQEHKGL